MTSSGAASQRATIEDVALGAGVSVATVSRALRGLPNVAASTRQRVVDVATTLHYRADPAASRFAAGRSQSIAVVVPVLHGWYFSQVLAGAEAICSAYGYDMIVMCVGDTDRRDHLLDATTSIHRRVDGIVFVDLDVSDEELQRLHDWNLRFVSIGAWSGRYHSIGIDEVGVGTIAANHLIELGHRRLGLISGQQPDPLGFVVPQLRRDGVESALAVAGLRLDPSMVAEGYFSVEGGRGAMHDLLSRDDPPTAVFALSDEMACGALTALRDVGLKAPDDVSVMGVDNHDVSEAINLTTVGQCATDHGSLAARLIIDLLTGKETPPTRLVGATELIVRGTTGPVPDEGTNP